MDYKKKLAATLVVVMMLSVMCGLVFGACNNAPTNTNCVVSYYLNNDDGDVRKVIVQSGAHATDWRLTRDGYNLVGWYTDRNGTQKYDFSETVTKNISLYAIWAEKPGIAVVRFDYGSGGIAVKSAEVEKQSKLDTNSVPSRTRLGMVFQGWYKDSDYSESWDFVNDTVEDDMTLYAKYAYDPTYVTRDSDGNVVYDNVELYVWVRNDSAQIKTAFNTLTEQFNELYKGKITIHTIFNFWDHPAGADGDRSSAANSIIQNDLGIRVQAAPERNKDDTYYTIADVYDLAGIDYDMDNDYYYGAAREATLDGEYKSIPLVASVPYIVYNKTLMSSYNNGKLPANYSEFLAILKKAYATESVTNSGFNSFIAGNQWRFREITSPTAFFQNGVGYYNRISDGFQNNWVTDGKLNDNVTTAWNNMYNLLGNDGEAHGKIAQTYDTGAIINEVKSGKALAGIVSYCGFEAQAADSNIGILPLSNMFTDDDTDAAASIPVTTFALSFFKYANNVSGTQLCAGALFSEYVSKNSYIFAENNYYPLYKAAVQSDEFVNSDNVIVNVLKQAGNPDNFITLPGISTQKQIINEVASPVIVDGLQSGKQDYYMQLYLLGLNIASLIY